jgi:hypothetical protein
MRAGVSGFLRVRSYLSQQDTPKTAVSKVAKVTNKKLVGHLFTCPKVTLMRSGSVWANTSLYSDVHLVVLPDFFVQN